MELSNAKCLVAHGLGSNLHSEQLIILLLYNSKMFEVDFRFMWRILKDIYRVDRVMRHQQDMIPEVRVVRYLISA